MSSVLKLKIAHRGIISKTAPENSIAALKNAVERGVAVELDVHLSKDNKVVVFHDYTLLRMCKRPLLVECTNYQLLSQNKLKNTKENIPLLRQVLQIIDGKVPVFIELKTLFNGKKLCDNLIKILDEYKGKVVVFGFNYRAVKYIKEQRNYTVMVSCFRPKFSFRGFVPDGICLNIKSLISYKKSPKATNIVSWTIHNDSQRLLAQRFGGYLEDIKLQP